MPGFFARSTSSAVNLPISCAMNCQHQIEFESRALRPTRLIPAHVSTHRVNAILSGRRRRQRTHSSPKYMLFQWLTGRWRTTANEPLADGVGFEPTRPLRACRFSRPVRSTAPPPIRMAVGLKHFWLQKKQRNFNPARETPPIPPLSHSPDLRHTGVTKSGDAVAEEFKAREVCEQSGVYRAAHEPQ